jgi:hypothetical protein
MLTIISIIRGRIVKSSGRLGISAVADWPEKVPLLL